MIILDDLPLCTAGDGVVPAICAVSMGDCRPGTQRQDDSLPGRLELGDKGALWIVVKPYGNERGETGNDPGSDERTRFRRDRQCRAEQDRSARRDRIGRRPRWQGHRFGLDLVMCRPVDNCIRLVVYPRLIIDTPEDKLLRRMAGQLLSNLS